MSQMEELRNEKKVEEVERAKHIHRRESVYQRERRKSEGNGTSLNYYHKIFILRFLVIGIYCRFDYKTQLAAPSL